MASLCDRCARPGTCCCGFVLGQGVLCNGPAGAVDAMLTEIVTCTNRDGSGSYVCGHGAQDFERAQLDERYAHVTLGLPFQRMSRDPDGRWRYWCPRLGADGRCRNYEARPGVCRALVPGAAKPCCHHVPGIGACTERAIDHTGGMKILPAIATPVA